MWCRKRTENIGWTDCVVNEVSNTVKEERNILHTIKLQKAKWIGHILHRNCLLKHITEGKTGGMKRHARRRKQPLDACMEKKTHEFERESIRSHSWELTLKMLWIWCNTDYAVNTMNIPSKFSKTCQNKTRRK
jgi:hypothetical protein